MPLNILKSLKTIIHQSFKMYCTSEISANEIKKRIAICQMRSTHDKEHNLQQVHEIIKLAKEDNADFLFLPECCDFVGRNRNETLEQSETLNGPLLRAYKEIAKNNRIWLSLGGIHEAIINENGEKSSKIYNSHIIIDDNGCIIANYRKLHLFDVNTPEYRFRESDIVKPGPCLIKPIQTPIGKIGLQICYDVRFPETSTILRKEGAQILTYPSAFAYTTGIAHWEVLLRCRALENQCFVIASAQIGYHNSKRRSYGCAMIVDPWGKILEQCKQNDIDVVVTTIDLKNLNNIQENMPVFDHRRDNIYSLVPFKLNSNEENNIINYDFSTNKIPIETVFYTSAFSYAFTNIRCVVEGHVLVATKRCIKRLQDMTSNEACDFFQTVCKVQQAIEKFYKATSSTVTIQDGEHAGQTVKHVHCHIMPRHEGDFIKNDDIYIELNKHDSDLSKNRRQLTQMAEEAKKYRMLFDEKFS